MPSKTEDATPSVTDLDQRESRLATEEVENALANAALRGQESALVAQCQALVARQRSMVAKRKGSQTKNKAAEGLDASDDMLAFSEAIEAMLLVRTEELQAREQNLVMRSERLQKRKSQITALEVGRDRASASLKDEEQQLALLSMTQEASGFGDTVDIAADEQGAKGEKLAPRSVRHASTLTMTRDEQVVHNHDHKGRPARKTSPRRPAPPVLDISGEDV
jgi:hypothetical protein